MYSSRRRSSGGWTTRSQRCDVKTHIFRQLSSTSQVRLTTPVTRHTHARVGALKPFGERRPLTQRVRMLARFFASRHAGLRRASAPAILYCCQAECSLNPTRNQPSMRGLPHIAENFKIEMIEARFCNCPNPFPNAH